MAPDWLHPHEGLSQQDRDRDRIAEYRQFVALFDAFRERLRYDDALLDFAPAELWQLLDAVDAARGRLEV